MLLLLVGPEDSDSGMRLIDALSVSLEVLCLTSCGERDVHVRDHLEELIRGKGSRLQHLKEVILEDVGMFSCMDPYIQPPFGRYEGLQTMAKDAGIELTVMTHANLTTQRRHILRLTQQPDHDFLQRM